MNYSSMSVLNFLLVINSLIISTIIILERRKPERTIAWILIFVLIPPMGILFYIFFGKMWHKPKPIGWFSAYNKEMMTKLIRKVNDTEKIPLIKLVSKNSNSPLFINNTIEIFKDGMEKFPVFKEELLKAKHHIHLEYYIVNSDTIGTEIKDVLIQKLQEGVKVRFIVDRIGSFKTSRRYFNELIDAGAEVVSYPYLLAKFLKRFSIQINYRNHRKIAVIDGKVGFIGGMNIGDEYLGKGKLGYWRDTHLMVKGDFVFGLQAVFFDDFLSIKKIHAHSILPGEALKEYYPTHGTDIGSFMQFAISGPDSEHPAIMQSFLKMILMAEKQIFISTPYFIPSDSIMDALKCAAISGVDISIIFPGKYDHFTVYKASMTYLRELVKYGVKTYFYDKDAFLHSKVITVDSKIASVGSANMDVRSFFLNYELNSIIYDEGVVEKLNTILLQDINSSVRVTSDYFDNLSVFEKFLQAISRIFSGLL